MLDRYFWLKYVDTFSDPAFNKNSLYHCTMLGDIFVMRSNDGKCICYSLDGKDWNTIDSEAIRKEAEELSKYCEDNTNKADSGDR